MPQSGSILGHAVLRREDPTILEGAARYFDDLAVDGVLHVVFVRSTIAHAELTGVDTSEAAGLPGVVAVYTGEDLDLAPIQGFVMLPPVFARPPFARDRVRFVGDIVAAVVAETRAQAVDAAELVIVDYEPLPAVVDPEAALADGAPLLFPEHGSNLAIEFAFGDEPTVFDGADVVVRERFVNQRVAAVPMEGNGIVVIARPRRRAALLRPDPGPPRPGASRSPRPRVWPRSRSAWSRRRSAAASARRPGMYVEFAIAAKAAMALGRPVKWTETRSENMVAMTQGRAQVQHVEMGLKRDGTIVGVRVKIYADGGAYPTIGSFLPFLTRTMAQGVYEIPKVEFTSWSAATNTTPTAAYRGAGRPEATAFLERIIDIAADELGIDPVEIRKRNFIAPGRVPAHARSPARTTTSASTPRRSTRRAASPGTTSCGASRPPGASAATSASSASVSRPTSRSPRAGCSRSTARSRCTKTAPSPRRWAPRRTARATRPRSR